MRRECGLVLAELDQFAFYPPMNVYFTDPNATEPVIEMVCRAMQSFLKAQDLQKEVADAWKAPEDGTVRFEARPNLARIPADQPATLFVRFESRLGSSRSPDRSPPERGPGAGPQRLDGGREDRAGQQAAIRVVEGLQKDDRISFVIYNHEVEGPGPEPLGRRARADRRADQDHRGRMATRTWAAAWSAAISWRRQAPEDGLS